MTQPRVRRAAPVAQECRVRAAGEEGGNLPQSGLCALHTDEALLTSDLSNLLPFFNPSQYHCYIDLYVTVELLLLQTYSWKARNELLFLIIYLFFLNEASKLSSYRCSAWHVFREEHLPPVIFVVEMFRTDSEVP